MYIEFIEMERSSLWYRSWPLRRFPFASADATGLSLWRPSRFNGYMLFSTALIYRWSDMFCIGITFCWINHVWVWVTSLCAGNSPVTGEFPTQMVSNAEIFSIWWRHHIHKIRDGYNLQSTESAGSLLDAWGLIIIWIELNLTWITNYIHYILWDKITYPFSTFSWSLGIRYVILSHRLLDRDYLELRLICAIKKGAPGCNLAKLICTYNCICPQWIRCLSHTAIQNYGCWWPGDTENQRISRNGIGRSVAEYPSISPRKFELWKYTYKVYNFKVHINPFLYAGNCAYVYNCKGIYAYTIVVT